MRALSKTFLLLLATFGLASCGGGGGGSQSAFNPTPVDSIAINAGSTSIPTNSFTILTVSVKRQDGTVEADGTSINATVTPATMGSVTPGSNTLKGGTTTFSFTSGNQTGTATVTISVPAGTNGTTTTATQSIPITITAGNGQDSRIQLVPSVTTLPVSPYSFAQQTTTPFPGNFPGSPYIAEVDITLRHLNGQLVPGAIANVSIAPTSVALLSTGTTLTQFQTLSSSLAVTAAGGVATVFVHAGNTPGTAVLTVTTTDPDGSGQIVSSQLTITVAGGSSSGLPAGITLTSSGPAYVADSGGQSPTVTARVTDGNSAPVPNPSGFDNVEFQILTANTDAQLSGVNAAGQTVKGTKIDVATHSGIAAVTLLPGLQQGPVQIKATADRGDNNVDNGIQDPVSATVTVVVSDGNLYNLTLTVPGPNANTLLINGVSTDASATVLPTDPNGTYSLTISAKGVDRQGNAVLPGTQIRFGEIDGPLNGPTGANRGQFAISGNDGNPAEGGTLFTAPTGAFTTAGGGAGPGDTLLVFGKLVTGNRDLENARTVARINSATSLNTVGPFNGNDIDTGTTVNSGSVLPYVIGHSLDGNITGSATTNEDGIATVKLTYPVSKLGKLAAVFAQGEGTPTKNAPRTVEDIMFVRFAGVAGIGDLAAAVTASPNPIFGNSTQQVKVCIADALGSPLQGIQFDFTYTGTGTAKVDNAASPGLIATLTDASGCAFATVVSSGVQPSTDTGGGGELKFCAGNLCATINVVVNIGVCQVSPSSVAVGSQGVSGTITLTAFDALQNKLTGAQITSACTASPGTIAPNTSISITNAQGVAQFPYAATGFVTLGTSTTPPTAGAGKCEFSAGGKVCATVPFNGFPSQCDFSPPPISCQ
jgi:hypothetical protein